MNQRIRRLLWVPALLLLAAVMIAVNRPGTNSAPSGGAQPGEQLPDFSAACLGGSDFTLSEQRGKVTVINLWATWCTPCVQELPNFDRLLREHPADVAVLAVHASPVTTDVEAYLAAFSYTMPFAVDDDGSLGEALNASSVLPQTVIVGPDGLVTYNQVGALSYEKLCELVDEAGK